MTLRIERSDRDGFTVFILSGRFEGEYIGELQRLFGPIHNYPKIILDLSEVSIADRDTIRFLHECESLGVKVKNCPLYIREWMKKEFPT